MSRSPLPSFRAARVLVALLLGFATIAGCGDRDGAYDQAGISFPDQWPFPANESPVVAENGMVVSTDAYASEVGVRIMKAGGNAVDAAVATSFALAVVNPEAGNIGGGGFMVIRLADGVTASLDYRERAPMAATRDMYLDESGKLTDKSIVGHLAVGVPGTVAGLWAAHQRFGSLPWAELLGSSHGVGGGVRGSAEAGGPVHCGGE